MGATIFSCISSAESTKPTVTQMVLVNPGGLQNKMNRPGTLRETAME